MFSVNESIAEQNTLHSVDSIESGTLVFEPQTQITILQGSSLCNLICIFIPRSVSVISSECFINSTLRHITFEHHSCLKKLEKKAFAGSTFLHEIALPASLEVIDEKCFSNCSSLSRVVFEHGSCLKQIGESAFKRCNELSSLDLPASVERIGPRAFMLSGTNICIDDENPYLKNISSLIVSNVTLVCMSCSVCSLTVPAFIEALEPACFTFHETLSLVTFEKASHLRRIGDRAFEYCINLLEVEIPASVEVIGDKCFEWCLSLILGPLILGKVNFHNSP